MKTVFLNIGNHRINITKDLEKTTLEDLLYNIAVEWGNNADKVEDETWVITHVFEAKAGNVNGLKAFLLDSLKIDMETKK